MEEAAKGGEKRNPNLQEDFKTQRSLEEYSCSLFCVVGQALSSSVPRSSAANVAGFTRTRPI